jgi:hypothetical protein
MVQRFIGQKIETHSKVWVWAVELQNLKIWWRISLEMSFRQLLEHGQTFQDYLGVYSIWAYIFVWTVPLAELRPGSAFIVINIHAGHYSPMLADANCLEHLTRSRTYGPFRAISHESQKVVRKTAAIWSLSDHSTELQLTIVGWWCPLEVLLFWHTLYHIVTCPVCKQKLRRKLRYIDLSAGSTVVCEMVCFGPFQIQITW